MVTREQINAIYEFDTNVIITEMASSSEMLDIWVLDEESMANNTHRSVILDREGNTLADSTQQD